MNEENFIKEHFTESLKDSGSSISKALRVAFAVGASLFAVFSLVYLYYIPRMRNEYYVVHGRKLFLATIPVVFFVSISVFFFVKVPLKNRKLKFIFFVSALIWISVLVISRAANNLMGYVGFGFFLFAICCIFIAILFFLFLNLDKK